MPSMNHVSLTSAPDCHRSGLAWCAALDEVLPVVSSRYRWSVIHWYEHNNTEAQEINTFICLQQKSISCCFLKPPLASFSIRIRLHIIFLDPKPFLVWKMDGNMIEKWHPPPKERSHPSFTSSFLFDHFWLGSKKTSPSFIYPPEKDGEGFPIICCDLKPPGLRATSPGNAFRLGFQKNIRLTRRSKSLSGMITIGIYI